MGYSSLFEECLNNLRDKAIKLSSADSAKIEAVLLCLFPFNYSNIDWNKVEKKAVIDSDPSKIISTLKYLFNGIIPDRSIYIMWDEHVPNLKTDLDTAIAYFDDITSVSSRTWFFNFSVGYVVEWHLCGVKTIGIASRERVILATNLKTCLDLLSPFSITFLQESKEMLKAIKNKFRQNPKYWKLSEKMRVTSPLGIIPCIKNLIKKSTLDENIYLVWNDESLPILKTNLNLVITYWDKIINLDPVLQLIDASKQFLVTFNKETGIEIVCCIGTIND